MNESELSVALEEESDAEAINSYRATVRHNPKDIARLGAMMAPRFKDFDPEALAAAALSLQDKAEGALVSWRERLVKTMNKQTLQDLLGALEAEDRDDTLHDPIVGPVVRRLHDIKSASSESGTGDDEQLFETFVGANDRAKLHPPGDPCDLEPALRYATAEPAARWLVLRQAFRDFLSVYQSKSEAERQDEYQDELKDSIDKIEARITEVENESEGDPDRKELISTKELTSLKSQLAQIEEAKDFRARFEPGLEAPAVLMQDAHDAFTNAWSLPNYVKRKDLKWLCEYFYKFWQKHGAVYRQAHEEREQKKIERERKLKESSEIRSKTGAMGPKTRDHGMWIDRTKAFIEFTNAKEVKSEKLEVSELLEDFVKGRERMKSSTTKKKVSDFFGTIWAERDSQFEETRILRHFQEKVRKGDGTHKEGHLSKVDKDTVRECHQLIQKAFASDA